MTIATIQILGRLGKDPELRKTQAGTSVCSLSLAVSDGTKDNQHTTWFRANLWERAADTVAKHFKKGDLIFISGSPVSREWESKDGQKQTSLDVQVQRWAFAGGKKSDEAPEPRREVSSNSYEEDDVPF